MENYRDYIDNIEENNGEIQPWLSEPTERICSRCWELEPMQDDHEICDHCADEMERGIEY